MSVSAQFSEATGQLVITVSGKFNFDLHREFRDAYSNVDLSRVQSFVIDLSNVGYMDSSALGMLLVLRELAGGDRSDITLRGAEKEVQQVLDVTHFERLFRIT
ncbi:MAG: STAS domain-containing protein [Chromatiales bacterium]|jgi:anti-anti-sigma factor